MLPPASQKRVSHSVGPPAPTPVVLPPQKLATPTGVGTGQAAPAPPVPLVVLLVEALAPPMPSSLVPSTTTLPPHANPTINADPAASQPRTLISHPPAPPLRRAS